MTFLTQEQINEFSKLLEQGYNYLAFNNGYATGFKSEETPYLALGCYRTSTDDTGEKIEIDEQLNIHSYALVHLQKLKELKDSRSM